MENQYCILPIGILEYVEFGIACINTYAYFEVIDIMGDKDTYPTLFGINWAFENYTMIDLKGETMTFEVDGVSVIQPLDPYQDSTFTELVYDVEEPNLLDQLYQLTSGKMEDYINPKIVGSSNWRSVQSLEVGSNVMMEDWK